MYTFRITYIFKIYNLNTFFSYISISVHSTLFNLCFFLYWCYIASLLCYSYACLYYHACLHYLNKKWSDKDTDLLYLKMVYIVEIPRISAFHGYMTCSTVFFFWVFVSDDFTLLPLVIYAKKWTMWTFILKGQQRSRAVVLESGLGLETFFYRLGLVLDSLVFGLGLVSDLVIGLAKCSSWSRPSPAIYAFFSLSKQRLACSANG